MRIIAQKMGAGQATASPGLQADVAESVRRGALFVVRILTFFLFGCALTQ